MVDANRKNSLAPLRGFGGTPLASSSTECLTFTRRRGKVSGMTVELASDVESFLREQVASGVCKDASELVNSALRNLRDFQAKPFETTSELEQWLLEAADEPAAPLTSQDFEDLRRSASEDALADSK